MTRELRLQIDSSWSPPAIAAILGGDFDVVSNATEKLRATYLDSFDWRVHRAGHRLVFEGRPGRGQLRLIGDDAPLVAVPSPELPRWAEDLPSGVIRDRLASALGIRALMVRGEATV